MTPNDIINQFPNVIIPEAAANVNKTIQYRITQPLYVTIKNGACEVNEGYTDKFDLAITMNDDHLVALMKGELNGMSAFMTGKLKIEGDVLFAQRIPTFFDLSKVFSKNAV